MRTKLLVLPALATLLPWWLGANPRSGDVFREYTWMPPGAYHVLTQRQTPLDLAREIDLDRAVRAEAVLEIGNAHLGFADIHIRVNGGEWRRISFPALGPRQPSPSRWFFQWQPVVPLPLSELKAGAANRFELRVAPKTYEGTIPHPAYFCVYSITFRVYYDPAKTAHATGRVVSPVPGSKLGDRVELAAAGSGKVHQVDFIGYYEDINYEGDGVYQQWHYAFDAGRLAGHLGTADSFGKPVVWNTSWTPDQTNPIQIAARITDDRGMIYLTRPAGGLSLARSGISVELAKPYDVPMSFTSCQYGAYVPPGSRAEKFFLKGDVTRIVAARFAISCWNAPSNHGFTVNGQPLEGVKLEGYAGNHHLFVVPLNPVTVLKAGENVFATIPGPARSSDVHWPDAAILVQYRK
ncbi:MAG: hypothetical protein NTW28_10480 [Candidatus Solibacter sp.]|nr:hypothetical protein [Candidatus Solibacter sp.]